MKCDICKEEKEDVQTFTLKDDQETLKLCKKDYDFMLKNNRVTGKLVAVKCRACHQPTGYTWIKYQAPGRRKKGAEGNAKLDSFFDMRSPMERLTQKRVRKKKDKGEEKVDDVHDGDNVQTEDRPGIQREGQADAQTGQQGEEGRPDTLA